MTAAAEQDTTFRQSFLALYSNCPMAAKLSREVPDYDTHAQARGTVFHEFGFRLALNCAETGEVKAPPGFAKDVMAECIRDSGMALPPAEFETLMMLAGEFAETREFNPSTIVDLETTYSSEIAGVVVTGKPDRLDIDDRVASITDYKTGWAIDPESKVKGSFQLRLYARLIADAYPHIHTFRLLQDYPRWGTEPREAVLTRDQLADIDSYLENLVERVVRSIDKDDWPATPGSWCVWCPDAKQCPIPRDYREEGGLETLEQAIAAGNLITAAEALVKAEKAKLRAYCDANGPIRVGDLDFEFRLANGSDRVIDKDVLRAAMEEAELSWDDHFKHVKGSTTFKGYKTKDSVKPAKKATRGVAS
jgi:hypothetical protein